MSDTHTFIKGLKSVYKAFLIQLIADPRLWSSWLLHPSNSRIRQGWSHLWRQVRTIILVANLDEEKKLNSGFNHIFTVALDWLC